MSHTLPTLEPIAQDDAVPTPRLWGLAARELHDAFWHGRGVQCVRRGGHSSVVVERDHPCPKCTYDLRGLPADAHCPECDTAVPVEALGPAPLQRAAELYLLMEPGQLVVFDLAEIRERLMWHDALATRLRLVDEETDPYSEQVVLDDHGCVERVERRYGSTGRETYRVVLTSERRLAAMWMAAADRREGWRRLRRSVDWSRIDHARLPGRMFREGDGIQERRMLSRLVEYWPQPDQAIDGIVASEPGVWHRVGREPADGVVRIGPLWLGDGRGDGDRRCLVGPDWVEDDPTAAIGGQPQLRAPVLVREISEVTMPTVSRRRVAGDRRRLYPAVKRVADVVVSAAALLGTAPIMAVIALMIVIEDGRPVFFGHTRQGRCGRPFKCWKFRTMYRNAEQIAHKLDAYNVCDGPQIYIQDDPRVTRAGSVLRVTHLDELPQFWNVLRGDMSLVGPRPSPDDENVYCPAWRDARLSVRPGITGLWQLERTREPGADFQEWIRYDLEYVRRAGPWLDLTILVKTARILLLGRPDREAE